MHKHINQATHKFISSPVIEPIYHSLKNIHQGLPCDRIRTIFIKGFSCHKIILETDFIIGIKNKKNQVPTQASQVKEQT